MYTDPISCVNINGYLSRWFDVKSGVQGNSLSPTLFNVVINDLVCIINRVEGGMMVNEEMSLLMYADDTVIHLPISMRNGIFQISSADEQLLQIGCWNLLVDCNRLEYPKSYLIYQHLAVFLPYKTSFCVYW